ncbi:hypothetical protein RclHR1_04900001 [Rhizophagus clarus]|uniref:Uncharacterized protein n=1 Tax=Rhizophagus clarus TaxID=94130 RepID=A0A2Z6RJC4_9GLOM|nr:hypothetical protein RclHR1_04900001 [Rhizophagus clarus]
MVCWLQEVKNEIKLENDITAIRYLLLEVIEKLKNSPKGSFLKLQQEIKTIKSIIDQNLIINEEEKDLLVLKK